MRSWMWPLCAMLGLTASGTQAQLVPIATCTLTLSASGKLAMSGDGLTMGSQVGSGLPAVMTVVGVNLAPKITFGPLAITGPTGWAGSPLTYLSASTAVGGQSQPYTASTFSMLPAAVLDTITINAKVVNSAGFKAGSYNGSTTITCEAA